MEVIETLKDSVKKADGKNPENNLLFSDIKSNTNIDNLNMIEKDNIEFSNDNSISKKDKALNDNNNKVSYLNTETVNQTYDNQIIFTDKNNYNDELSNKNPLITNKIENGSNNII